MCTLYIPNHYGFFCHRYIATAAKGTFLKIMKAGSRPTKKVSSDWFTGTVWQDPII